MCIRDRLKRLPSCPGQSELKVLPKRAQPLGLALDLRTRMNQEVSLDFKLTEFHRIIEAHTGKTASLQP
eukprot:1196030-Alexandrium_andersonii.AAC.1